ncbi:YggS family pyridoxal phosphate-dependent enzyme [Aureliella helgolandensis]|uniref:Pyridoxal phosphate homeostasis protein n=1 Tax=Aureliella helgolandensis TaxID=2527968 RepID=A0A518G2D1_9BACT|nr:YggS family pyridoxal phosphate-dependent enzyme [Aureliella helgolandensis]QDV22742.1 Pyridoxal phosphate homeostasis protein [Aureliella helgolandensis]
MDATAQTQEVIRQNWLRVQEQVAEACEASGRNRSEVTIVGVSKYVPPEFAYQLTQAGCDQLGENRPQSLWDKYQFCEERHTAVEWHMIGHLQRNKIRRTLPMLRCIHSLDSLRLAQALSEAAVAQGSVLTAFLEVNVSEDQSKTGLPRSQLVELLEHADSLPGLQLSGLMAMSTHGASATQTRREFAAVRELRDTLNATAPSTISLTELSMGMSGDFADAIAEGATLVRIGSSLWEGIDYHHA